MSGVPTSQMARLAPASASMMAMAPPWPRAAPVKIAVFPAKSEAMMRPSKK
jgi:hypothetical protein